MHNDKKKNPSRSASPLYWSAESWAFMALRLFLGLRFVTAAIGKFKGETGYAFSHYYQGYVPGMAGSFEGTYLPGFLVTFFAYLIAYVELGLGILLLLGVRTKHTLAAVAMTYVCLGFGKMVAGEAAAISQIAIHILLVAAALYFVRHNKLELLR